MSPPKPAVLVAKLVGGVGYGPGGLSAALALGLSTQVPRIEQYAIPTRKPEGISNIDFRSRAARRARLAAKLRPNEVALLEVLHDWDALVEIPRTEARDRIAGLLGNGELDRSRLAMAARSEPRKVQQELRELLAL